MDNSMPASIAIWNKNNVWIPDNMVTKCHACLNDFGLLNRKHHCRNCGNVFCYSCCNQMIMIPDYITDKPKAADYWNITHYIKTLKDEKEKVCKVCFQLINEKIKAREKVIELFNNPVPIDKIKELSDHETDIKNDYLDQFRNIQYYLPNHTYTTIDCKLLDINACHFLQHSKYMMHYIKSIPWKLIQNQKIYEQKKAMVMNLINGKKVMSCKELFCTRTCQEYLTCDDCINILYSHANYLPFEILKYLFETIMDTSNEVILCNLPFFITMIKDNDSNKLIQNLLMRLINTSSKIIYRTYWLLKYDLYNTGSKSHQIKNIATFLSLFNEELITQMDREYDFFNNLMKNINDPVSYLTSNFDKYKPITVPYDPDIIIIDVSLNDIVIKNSYTKPVIITFITNKEPIKILFKNESVINDMTVLNLMSMSDIILRESVSPNFKAIIYPVLPIGQNSGMIEIVNNATTIHDIATDKKTILQHILKTNEDKLIGEVINKYMFSLVSYTLHSYFIGLGDRHMQNIMITNDGSIFHIDFGFILGKDAHPIVCGDIKLNKEMLDVIGGQGSFKYETYLELCSQGTIILRKFFNIFFILLLQIQSDHMNESIIEKFIMSRFQPRQTDHTVISEIMAVIQHSNDTYGDIIRDFLHFHSQEKTMQNKLSEFIYTTYNVIRNVATESWGLSK